MKLIVFTCALILSVSFPLFSQSLDSELSVKKMKKDFEVFKEIRLKANSGLYKYRTKSEIDSIYQWADKAIEKSKTYLDFYNIISQLTDFEGSLHNDTYFSKKVNELMIKENHGYFPFPIKLIEGKWIFNSKTDKIPLGVEIISINNQKMDDIIPNLYKYYTTDGINITGKSIGINRHFSRYYRFYKGLQDTFNVTYKAHNSSEVKSATLQSVSYKTYYKNVANRYSKPFDEVNYKDWEEEEIYTYNPIDEEAAILTVNSFAMGSEKSKKHLRYLSFLDSIFVKIKKDNIKNLIVDVRYNGGGSDPNDLVTYEYLTQRNFSENKQAWVSFRKIPKLRYIDSKFPAFLRPFVVGKFNREFQNIFPLEKDGKYYQDESSDDHKIRFPNENAFTGNIFLLISPRTASAGSLFAAMVAGNENTITIGEESMGGYYGHNGHTSLDYILPKSKIGTSFSVVNLEQDVPKNENQIYNRGIIPDHIVIQTFEDYMSQTDTQMNFVMDLINSKGSSLE